MNQDILADAGNSDNAAVVEHSYVDAAKIDGGTANDMARVCAASSEGGAACEVTQGQCASLGDDKEACQDLKKHWLAADIEALKEAMQQNMTVADDYTGWSTAVPEYLRQNEEKPELMKAYYQPVGVEPIAKACDASFAILGVKAAALMHPLRLVAAGAAVVHTNRRRRLATDDDAETAQTE